MNFTSYEISGYRYFTQTKLLEIRTELAKSSMPGRGRAIHEIDLALNEKGGGGVVEK